MIVLGWLVLVVLAAVMAWALLAGVVGLVWDWLHDNDLDAYEAHHEQRAAGRRITERVHGGVPGTAGTTPRNDPERLLSGSTRRA